MRITVSELREQIAAIDQSLKIERAALKEAQARIRDLRQTREAKMTLMRKLLAQGLDSIELPI
jgi:hypothetical protein